MNPIDPNPPGITRTAEDAAALIRKAKAADGETQRYKRLTADTIRERGLALLAAKAQAGSKQWLSLLAREWPEITPRTAQRWIKQAQEVPAKYDNVSHLDATLHALTAPDTDDPTTDPAGGSVPPPPPPPPPQPPADPGEVEYPPRNEQPGLDLDPVATLAAERMERERAKVAKAHGLMTEFNALVRDILGGPAKTELCRLARLHGVPVDEDPVPAGHQYAKRWPIAETVFRITEKLAKQGFEAYQ